MRLGGPVFEKFDDPDLWAAAVRRQGYSAAYCPLDEKAPADLVATYAATAERADIVIAEVGAWSNPLSPDEQERRKAIALCQRRLALAEQIGARCCVNISGSRGSQWDGPHPDNLTQETFDLIVQTIRAILDEVRPRRTFYTLETMPWMYPDSADSYLRLLKAVDRRQFAAHFDPVNLICSPQRYYANAELVRDFVVRLGPHIRCVHAKDIALSGRLTVHLDEVAPGKGGLDYSVLLSELDRLDADLPVLLEHLPDAAQYAQAADFIRSVAARAGAMFR